MNTKVDTKFIRNILDRKSRNRTNSLRWLQYRKRWDMAYRSHTYLKENKEIPRKYLDEICKYFPIAMIACLEDYVRICISELINHGKPFSDNARGFKDFSFKIDSVLEITNKKITIGEIIAHALPVNSMDNIFSHFNVLTEGEFSKNINSLLETAISLCHGADVYTPDTILRNVSDTFRLRHIFAHELSMKEKLTIDRSESLSLQTFLFASSIEISQSTLIKKGSIFLKSAKDQARTQGKASKKTK